MHARFDEEGNQYNLMEYIVDHKVDDHAVDHDDIYIKNRSNKQVIKATKGY
jgi:hypothetical protein